MLKKVFDIQHSISTKEILKWLWAMSGGVRAKTLANTAIGLADVCLDFVFIWATKNVIDTATGSKDASLVPALCIIVGVFLLQIGFYFLSTWINALLGVRGNNRMQLRTFSRILDSAWGGKEKLHSGDTMNRIIGDSNCIMSLIGDSVPAIIVMLFRFVGAFIFLYMMSPMMAVVLICIVPLFLLLSKLYIGKMRTKNREVRDAESRVQSIMQETIQNRVVIKTLEQCGAMVIKLSKAQDDLLGKVIGKTKFSSVSNLVMSLGFSLGYCITFIWSVTSLQSGAITYGMMLAFIQLVGQIQQPVRGLAGYIPVIVGAFTSAERLIELDSLPVEERGEPLKLEGEVGIRGDRLSFRYDNESKYIMDGLSFDFRPGTVTAVVGETGSGKTTLVRLILALLSPTDGSLELYSKDGGRLNVSPRTRCNMIYVPQGNTLLSGTVRDNLLLGNPDAADEEMESALKTACAEFVFEKNEGLDFQCGEKGSGLSEGQAQRLAIARALLRPGGVMVFDEATSALDKTTEEKLIANLLEYSRENRKTLIMVTHRAAILDSCSATLDFDKISQYRTVVEKLS